MSLAEVYDKPGHLIRHCQQIVVALSLDRCSGFDLTPVQYAVLRTVHERPEADPITVAGLAALDRSNMAWICLGLEERGLLLRLPDPADRQALRTIVEAHNEHSRAPLRFADEAA